MKRAAAGFTLIACLAGLVVAAHAAADPLWWERGADRWYYKDDWKGLALSGANAYTKTLRIPGGAVSGWIVVWGDGGYRLSLNGKPVGSGVDGGLIDDYDLAACLDGSAEEVTLRIEGAKVCAEGELLGPGGKRVPFATGEDWQTADGRKPAAQALAAQPSSGAYDRARNGTLITYNDEERGKAAIAKGLARIQRLRDQALFLMRRLRPADEILSFTPNAPWRTAERAAEPFLDRARSLLTAEAVPAQKAGKFAVAVALAGEAAALISAAEAPVAATADLYRAEREVAHLENVAAILGRAAASDQALVVLRDMAREARGAHALGDWAGVARVAARISGDARDLATRIEQAAARAGLPLVGGAGRLDEFPEDQFGWLNARALMGNGPAAWPFIAGPSSAAYVDLAGLWEFRTDPDNVGLKSGWHADPAADGWMRILAPKEWERQGCQTDNANSPADAPYRIADARCFDKPYNGFAWYRKRIFIPEAWQGKRVMLATGTVTNWARVFLNGKPVGDGRQNPPAAREVPPELLRFGQENLLAVQVYNHNNFGGITAGPLAVYLDGAAPVSRETPGPLAFVREDHHPASTDSVHYTFLAGALSPGVLLATDGPAIELRGWEAKGYPCPSAARFVAQDGPRTVTLERACPVVPDGAALAEGWIHLEGVSGEVLIVLERRPTSVAWKQNPLGSMSLLIACDPGPVRAAVLVLPPGTRLDKAACSLWAQALRRYPVAASECVAADAKGGAAVRTNTIRYNYLALADFAAPAPARPSGAKPPTVAPLPMLASYGLAYRHPWLTDGKAKPTAYRSEYAPYRVVRNADTITYRAPAVDRSMVMKGVGELFARRDAARNARGGLGEDVMFQRMRAWGFDHLRYAWAFHADWDLPLVEYVGGPLLQDNDAAWRRLDELVDKTNAAGLQMMLCWFFNEDAPQADTGGAVRNSTRYWRAHPEAQANAFELWRRIAKRYANRPAWAVSYDFFNEPAYMNPDHWNQVVRELTAVVRSVDKKHLIVWEAGDGWAQPHWCLWMQPVKDSNVLYSFHHYGKHWGYAYDEYYPGYRGTPEAKQIDAWLEAILFSIRHNVPIHCGEFGLSMIQPTGDGEAWLEDYLALFERFGIGWNWWNYSGNDVYRTGLAAGNRISPYVPILRKWIDRSGWGAARRQAEP